jgi:hypothetical protein
MPSESVAGGGGEEVVYRGEDREDRRGTDENCTARWDEREELLYEITRTREKRTIEGEGDRILELLRKGGNVSLFEDGQERRVGGGGRGGRMGQIRKRRTGWKKVDGGSTGEGGEGMGSWKGRF